MVLAAHLPVRALIIHLDTSNERASNVEKLITYVEAVGVESVQIVPAVQPPDRGPLYSAGEWGCYQSHGVCLRRAREMPADKTVMVLEDDIEFQIPPDRMRSLLQDGLSREWDLLYLGYSKWGPLRAWDDELLAQPWLKVRGMIYGTTCYLTRPEGFARVVDDYDALAFESPMDGGGVGADGAFAELSYRDPSIVRVAPLDSLVEEVIGISSTIRAQPSDGKFEKRKRLLQRKVKRLLLR